MNGKKKDSLELVDLLRRAILFGEYKPRERLIETALAEKYSVSRTPVREALKHLEALGLVKMERYKGAIVSDINLREIKEMHVVRSCLEGLSAQLACPLLNADDLAELNAHRKAMEELAASSGDIREFSRHNDCFHRFIFEKCGNQYLLDTYNALLKRSWHEPSTSWKGLGDVPQTLEGHRCIYEALSRRDADAARKAAEKHMTDAIKLNESLGRYVDERDFFTIGFREV